MLRTRRPSRASRWSLACVALASLLAAGCGKAGRTDTFPLEAGFQPLEPLSTLALAPAGTVGDPHPQGLGNIAEDKTNLDHYASHARGFVHYPLAAVYQAFQDHRTGYIHNEHGGSRFSGGDTPGGEDFPVSYVVHYSSTSPIGDINYDVTYRAGTIDFAGQTVAGLRYQKTGGTGYISVMDGSFKAYTPDETQPDVTAVEIETWLQAQTQGQGDCDGTVTDLFGNLVNVLAILNP